jgi:hypothetical protein
MFAFISQNWRGKPLLTHKVIVQLIAATKTTSGLNIGSAIDVSQYPKGYKVSDLQIAKLKIKYDDFHPEWNYTISPRQILSASPSE